MQKKEYYMNLSWVSELHDCSTRFSSLGVKKCRN